MNHKAHIAVFVITAFVCGCGSTRDADPRSALPPLCVLAPEKMPPNWRPSGKTHASLSQAEWSAAESQDAALAVQRGLSELSAFFREHPESIATLEDDAVESLIDASYAASNMPALQTEARAQARRALGKLLDPLMRREARSAGCPESQHLLVLTIYTDLLYPAESEELRHMVSLANGAFHNCGSLEAVMGYDYQHRLRATDVSINNVWDMLMWSIEYTGAQVVPGLSLPDKAPSLPLELWRFLERYPLTSAREYAEGAANETFYQTAYLATHIAYLPTGYGRYRIYISDSPGLYAFLRENFYEVLERGELDLSAEFVDLFRQYGCTEQNDLHIRDGTRYLLKRFHSAGDQWMDYRQQNAYDTIHAAWTGMAGVRARVPEPTAPGTYGAVVRSWLGHKN